MEKLESAIKAMIFDVDGTLVDSEPLHNLAWQQALGNIRGRETVLADEVFAAISGKRPIDIARMFVSGMSLSATPEELLHDKTELFVESLGQVKPMPGAVELVKRVSQTKTTKLAIGTSLDRHLLSKVLEQLDIADAFDVIVTGDEITNGKPDPETYLRVVEKLGLEPNQCLVFEDSRAGIQSAQSAGCNVVMVRSDKSKDGEIKDLVTENTIVISSLEDFTVTP